MKERFTMKLILILFGCFITTILARHRVEDTYSNCIRVPKEPSCPSEYRCRNTISGCFRSMDGSCNNLKRKLLGAVNTPLRRLIKPQYDDGVDLPRGHPKSYNFKKYPTPHQVSKATFTSKSRGFSNSKKLSTMFMTFGQFLDHDLSLSPHETCNVTDCSQQKTKMYPCLPIKFDHHSDDCTGFARSKPVCKDDPHEPRNQLNELTSFIDLSMIYGPSHKKQRSVRKMDGSGEIKMDKNGILPVDPVETAKKECKNPAKCHLLGDKRGEENIALFSMHILWAREHNRIAKELRGINPHWSGEQVFQTARKILGGVFQHIVYNEYLPNVIYPFERRTPRNTRYNPHADPSIIAGFSTAAFRYGHSLIPNSFSQMDKNFEHEHAPVRLQHAFENSTQIVKVGICPTLLGLCGNMSGDVNGNFAHDILKKLFVFPGSRRHNDLTALNIQRGRDHGIPTFKRWREFCGFPKARSFYDLLYTPKETRKAFSKIYNSVDDIDLFAVGITERHIGTKVVGPTFHCIIREQFRSLRDGDRFFYTHHGVFKSGQLDTIKKMTLSKVMCNNLKKDGMVSIQRNAFKVFDPKHDGRVACENLPGLDLTQWRDQRPSYLQRNQYNRHRYGYGYGY